MGGMGEFELLARVRERLPAAGRVSSLGSGDDAAVTVPGGATATSVDALVEGVHFRRDRRPSARSAHKALATALSDLAAMGAEAGEAYVVLGVPPDLDEDGCLELLDGMVGAGRGDRDDPGRRRRHPRAGSRLAVTVVGHAPAPEPLWSRRARRPARRRARPHRRDRRRRGRPAAARRPRLELTALPLRQADKPPQRLRGAAARADAAAGGRARPRRGRGDGDDRPQRRARAATPAISPRASGVGLRIEAEALPLAAGGRRGRGRRRARSAASWPSRAARTTSCWRRSRPRRLDLEAAEAVRERRESR